MACCSIKFHIFLICFLDLVCDGCSWYGFSQICSHISFWETKCFNLLLVVALHDRVNIAAIKNIYLSKHGFSFLSIAKCLFVVNLVFNIIPIYHCEISPKYSLSMTSDTHTCDHLHFWLLFGLPAFIDQTCFIKLFLSSLYLFGFGVLYPKKIVLY